jgi:hypothetical protein
VHTLKSLPVPILTLTNCKTIPLMAVEYLLGAVRQIPVKTTLGNSSRPTVAQMKPPGTSLHWLSGGVFFAASIGLIAWAIWEYNSNIDRAY